VDVKLAEAPAQRLMLRGRQILISEEYDQVVDQRIVDSPNVLICQRLRQVYSFDLRTDRWSELEHRKRLARHYPILDLLPTRASLNFA
jgi:hypothetical protein